MIGTNRRGAGVNHLPATASGRLAARCFPPVALALGLMLGLSCGGGSPTAPTGPAPVPVPPDGPTPTQAPQTRPPLIGRPCPGVVVRGRAPRTTGTLSAATLTIEWENGSGGSFDWSGPYFDDDEDSEDRSRFPLLEVNVAEWRIETTATATRHELRLEWPRFLAAGLRFHSGTGTCDRPVLVCGRAACLLRQ